MSGVYLLHATAAAVAVDPDGPLAGALLVGPPGAGKSTLALQLVSRCPWRRTKLVADDAVRVTPAVRAGVDAAPQPRIAGLVEVRGVGVAPVPHAARVRIVAVFDLARSPERLPDAADIEVAPGVRLPAYALDGRAPGACDLVRFALRQVLGGHAPQSAQDWGRLAWQRIKE